MVGSGDILIASSYNLSLGEHTITLTGIDSYGQTATYSTHITITAGYSPPEAKPLIPSWIIIAVEAAAIVAFVAIGALVLVLLRKRK